MKTCTKCGEEKELSEFYKDKTKSLGVRPSCKACNKEGEAKYRKENPDKIKERGAKYRKENPDKGKERGAKYRKENPDKGKETAARYRKELSSTYVKKILRKKFKKDFYINASQLIKIEIPEELIALKRIELACKRFVKQSK
jgi:hypothetical protein